tara:strand:+ start:24479 stop:26326 length:1848 start_codon:yes stop_codon:yes gene_type:complete
MLDIIYYSIVSRKIQAKGFVLIIKLLKRLSFLVLLLNINIYAQIAIGNINPDESSLLDIGGVNATEGLLLPQVNIINLNNQSPITGAAEEGLIVYNTNTSTGKGFYYWDSAKWQKINTGNINLYTANSALNSNRIINASTQSLSLSGSTNRNSYILKRTDNSLENGFSFRNSGNYYDNAIYVKPNTGTDLVFATGSNVSNPNSLTPTLTLRNDNGITLNAYGKGNFSGTLAYFLNVDNNGNLIEEATQDRYRKTNNDWYLEKSTNAPISIDDNIYTNGLVGINTNNPNNTFTIYETSGSPVSATEGTIIIEHGDDGGKSSIVFPSGYNSGSDYAFIQYQDNKGGSASSGHDAVLELAVMNNGNGSYQDDININAAGSLGINNVSPAISASIDMGRSNQGLLINKVQLKNITDNATIQAAEPDGLLVYNTTAAGSSPNNVVEGFYYWDNNRWNLIKAYTSTIHPGMQFYSYDIAENSAPDIDNVEYETLITKAGAYNGILDSNAAIATMNPTTDDTGYVIKITGTYEVMNSGNFNFSAHSDDGVRLYIDGSIVLDSWLSAPSGGLDQTGSANLGKGKHKFEFWYFQYTGPFDFKFSWGSNTDGKTGVIKASDFTVE